MRSKLNKQERLNRRQRMRTFRGQHPFHDNCDTLRTDANYRGSLGHSERHGRHAINYGEISSTGG